WAGMPGARLRASQCLFILLFTAFAMQSLETDRSPIPPFTDSQSLGLFHSIRLRSLPLALVGKGLSGWFDRDICHQREIVPPRLDRKSTRLNSSHVAISYAVFCLKKKNRRAT